jgi:hypothetical protein
LLTRNCANKCLAFVCMRQHVLSCAVFKLQSPNDIFMASKFETTLFEMLAGFRYAILFNRESAS